MFNWKQFSAFVVGGIALLLTVYNPPHSIELINGEKHLMMYPIHWTQLWIILIVIACLTISAVVFFRDKKGT